MKQNSHYFLFSLSLLWTACSGPLVQQQPVALAHAHAHNDYRHDRPLLDALDHGFTSIEADVHLLNNELFVCHDKEEITPDRTLRSLYLDPLQNRVRKNRGAVFDKKTTCYLFIDIKTNADSTYAVLDPLLHRYKKIISEYDKDKCKQRAVSVVLSGNRPKEMLKNQKKRYAAQDGRVTDLQNRESSTLTPIISDKWTDHFTWCGQGPLPSEEKLKLEAYVNQAHRDGRKIRFWATDVDSTAGQTALWNLLYESGVDLINTDKLTELKSFLLEKNGPHTKE